MASSKRRARSFYNLIVQICGSKYFFIFLICLIAAQGLWFALTFMPGIFDEKQHFDFINMYTEHISPFISKQDTRWDSLGEITRSPSYLFYYLMSWPLRAVKLVSDSYFIQVFSLRLIMLSIFVVGIFLYRKLIIRVSNSRALAHLALLLVVLTPAYASFAGAINYDLAIFALVPFILLNLLDILQAKKPDLGKITIVIALGMAACLIKFSFLPIFVASVLYIMYDLWLKHGKKVLSAISFSWRKLSLIAQIAIATSLIFSSLLFIERPVASVLKYQRVVPPCTKILSEERCLKNYTAARSIKFRRNKPNDFKPVNPGKYFLKNWSSGQIHMEVRVVSGTQALPVLMMAYHTATVVGLALILIYLRDFLRDKRYRVLLIISGTYIVALFAENYAAYMRLGQPVAITARYLLPVVPILLYFMLLASKRMLAHRLPNVLASLALLIPFVIVTQGGSVATHQLTVPDYRWSNKTMRNINKRYTDFIHFIAVEKV